FSSRRRHTRFSRDWSSDVCSSDLLRILLAIAIFFVTRDGIACMGGMHANLVRTPSANRDRQEGRDPSKMLDGREGAERLLPLGMNAHDSFAPLLQIRLQRQIDLLRAERPMADDERKIGLLHLTLS